VNNKKKNSKDGIPSQLEIDTARKLLRSPHFLTKLLRALENQGLVGEKRNALVLFVVAVSRLLPRPLNVFVKGHSSAGKNFLVKSILRLLPLDAVAEITSASDKAWNYSKSSFRHKIIYLQEKNEAAGTIDPIRLLISEGKLVRIVPRWVGGKLITTKQVAHGPVASISTTTRNRLQIDDETRHISEWVDESPEQTRKIVESYTKQRKGLDPDEIKAWHAVQHLLERRIGTEIIFPRWFEEIANQLFISDLRVRRYYPAFIEAVRSVCLIRSFLPHRKSSEDGPLKVRFADFAITALIFDEVFVESLHLGQGAGEATRRLVEEIVNAKGAAIDASDVSAKLGIPSHQASAKLRYAEKAGVIRRANTPERNNRKWFLPMPRPHFVPDPAELFQQLKSLKGTVRFIHPITGKWMRYRHEN
jgi:hypothetical protein